MFKFSIYLIALTDYVYAIKNIDGAGEVWKMIFTIISYIIDWHKNFLPNKMFIIFTVLFVLGNNFV